MRDWIEWVTDRERFSALRTHWGQFAAANRNPFSDHAWFAAWRDAFGSGALRMCAL